MSRFVNKLQDLVERSNVSSADLAKCLGVSKLELGLIYDKTIKITPKDFENLVGLLQLNFMEEKEFEKLFDIYLTGEDEYGFRAKIREFIDQITIDYDSIREDRYFCESTAISKGAYFEGIYQYDSRIALIMAMKRVIAWSLCNDERTKIKLAYDIKDEFLLAYFYELYSCYDVNLQINHLTTLNSLKSGDSAMNILMYLIPLVISSKCQYSCYYNNEIVKLSAGDFSNYMIVNDKIFIFSDDMGNGLLISGDSQVELFAKKFDRSVDLFKPLIYSFEENGKYEQIYKKLFAVDTVYSVEPGIYINNYLTREMLEKYYVRDSNDVENSVNHMAGFLGTDVKKKSYHVASTIEGFIEFIKNGINISMPPFGDVIFSPVDRREIINRMIEDIKRGVYELVLVNSDVITFPKELLIIPSQTDGVIISFAADFKKNDKNFAFYIDDAEIGKQFCDFIDSLRDDGLAFSKDDTIIVLKQLMNLYL